MLCYATLCCAMLMLRAVLWYALCYGMVWGARAHMLCYGMVLVARQRPRRGNTHAAGGGGRASALRWVETAMASARCDDLEAYMPAVNEAAARYGLSHVYLSTDGGAIA